MQTLANNSDNALYIEIQYVAESYLQSQQQGNKANRDMIFKELLDVMKPIEVRLDIHKSRFAADLVQDYRCLVLHSLTNYDSSRGYLFVTYCLSFLRHKLAEKRLTYESGGVASGYVIKSRDLKLEIHPVDYGNDDSMERAESPDHADFVVDSILAKELLSKLEQDPKIRLVAQMVLTGYSVLQACSLLGLSYNDVKYRIKKCKALI